MTLREVNWLNAAPPDPDSGLVMNMEPTQIYSMMCRWQNSTLFTTTDRHVAMPLYVTKTTTFSELLVAVSQSNNDGNVQLGVYWDESGYPKELIVAVTVFVTANQAYVGGAINITLEPGLYWLTCIMQDRPNFTTPYLMGTSQGPQTWGMAAIVSGGNGPSFYELNRTFTTVPPDPFPAGAVVSGSGCPRVVLKVAA